MNTVTALLEYLDLDLVCNYFEKDEGGGGAHMPPVLPSGSATVNTVPGNK